MKHYKFLDVGCKNGNSFLGISKRFNYLPEQGFGIDINSLHVTDMIKAGHHAMVASATEIPFRDNQFELVIFNHVLEHMASEEIGFQALAECLRVSTKQVVIGLPFFDEDDYLKSNRLKTFYSDWSGHKNKVRLSSIKKFLDDAGYTYIVDMRKKLLDSFATEILPIHAPRNSHDYDSEKHGIKTYVKFEVDIWREYQMVINK
jgi:ubiquinone/menaquinone biosynthesis C-methylase UbiE